MGYEKQLIAIIDKSWGWLDVCPQEVIATNEFGNVVFTDRTMRYWRICPEELTCEVIAANEREYESLLRDDEFLADWKMSQLVAEAHGRFREQPEGRCFCLKIPAVLGGEYAIENIATISLPELIAFAGDVAHQIKDVPDGAPIRLKWID